MGLFRQAAINAQKQTVIGHHLIPVNRHLTILVWLSCVSFVWLTLWVLTRQYEQTRAIQGVTQYAQGEFPIVSPYQGIISDIHITPNQNVVQGQALFTINMLPSSGFTTADIELQQAQYTSLQARLLSQQANIDSRFNAQKQYLEQSTENTQRVIKNLREQLLLLTADYLAQQTQHQRMQSLFNKRMVSSHQIEQHHIALRSIKSRRLDVEQTLIERESQLALFKQQVVNLVADKDEQLANVAAHLLQNLTKLQALKFQTSAVITAPKDGIITRLLLNEGETIFHHEPLGLLVPERGELVGRLVIPSTMSADIDTHQSVHLQMSSYPHTFYGQLTTTIKSIDTPSFQTHSTGLHALVAIPNEWRATKRKQVITLTSGMNFTALVVIEQYPLWQKIWLKLTQSFSQKDYLVEKTHV